MNVCDIEYNLLLLVYKLDLSVNVYDFMTHFDKSLKTLSINIYKHRDHRPFWAFRCQNDHLMGWSVW